MKKILIVFAVFSYLISCKSNQTKISVNEKFIEDTLLSLKEVQEKNLLIDSLTNHKQGISFITEKPSETEPNWSIQVGYNCDERFETYFQFYINPESKQISILDFISGNKLSLENWRNIGNDSVYLELGMKLLNTEQIGNLKINMPETEITKVLGIPDEKSKPLKWETDGLFHQDWIFKEKGIELDVCWEKPTDLKISGITVDKQSKFKTLRNIGIGSTRFDVLEKYKKEIDSRTIDMNSIIAGSVFGGIFFTFENNKVTNIFIGASAE